MHLLRKIFGSKPPAARDAAIADRTCAARAAPGVDPADAVAARADTLVAAGSFAASLALIDAALAARPGEAGLLLARISTLLAWGRVREAHAMLLRLDPVRAIRPADHATLGAAFLRVGDLAKAEAWMRRAVAGDPASSQYRAMLAATLHRASRVDESVATYGEALALQSDDFDALMGLGSCELDRRDPVAAEAWFRRAIESDGDRAVAWSYLGVALDRQDRGAEGLAAHEQATALEAMAGDDVDAYLGLAGSLRDDARFDDAIALLEANLARRQSAEAQTLYSQVLLVRGRLPEGWHHSEYRWLTEQFLARRPRFAKPAWDRQDLRGRTILLRAEQGMGDTLQFARYAPLVKALGATVHLAIPSELVQVAEGLHGVDRVFVLRQNETESGFDFHIPLLSLPRVFATELATVPAAVPYLDVDHARVARWAARLAQDRARLKVGLVWAGNPVNLQDRYRSMPLAALAPLGSIAGVRFYSLQKGAREHEATTPPPGLDIVDLGPELTDFGETAAALVNLDLVVCVDTAVAHLAGALARPLWLLVPTPSDWRWLERRNDSPWYPTARLFRQTRRGEWADVVESVRLALLQRLRDGAPDVAPVTGERTFPLPVVTRPCNAPGFRAGHGAVAETRYGILEYFPGDAAAGDSVGWYGEWLQPQLDLMARLIRRGATVLEVGAGIGAHAALLGTAVGEAGNVFAYEWRAPMRRVLRQNLAANRVTSVTIMPRMPFPTGGRVTVESDGRASNVQGDAMRAETGETLDELRLERLAWLKINDGAPVREVLAGAGDTLWRLRPALFLSAANTAELDGLAVIAKAHGYRCWRHETALFNPRNFNRRENDIFEGRKALALVAFPEEVEFEFAHDGCVELA